MGHDATGEGARDGGGRISRPVADTLPPGRRGRRARALARWLLGALGWLLLSVVALVASAWLHVFTPVARDLLRRVVTEQVNAGIRGRVEIGRIDEVAFGTVGVSDLSIFDVEGRQVLRVEQASVDPDLAALTGGTIGLHSVRLRDGELSLIETADGSPSIAGAFASRAPSPPSTGPGPDVRIDTIAIEGLRVRSTYAPVGDLSVEDLAVDAGLSIGGGVPSGEVRSARFDLLRAGRRVGALRHLSASYAGGDGEARADVALALGDGRIEVDARAALPRAPDAQPSIEGTVTVSDLGPTDVEALGLVDTGPWVGTVGGRIQFDGTPRTFAAEADVTTTGGDVHAEARMRDGDRLEATVRTDGFEPARVLAGVAAPGVRGKVGATVTGLTADPRSLDVEARLTDVVAGEWRVPSLEAAAHVATDRVRVDRLRLPYLDGELDVRGTVGFDGAADLHVDADVRRLGSEPNLRRLLPGLSGELDARLHVSVEPGDGGAEPGLAVRGEAELRRARVGPARVARLRVAGTARGTPSAPVVDASVRGEGLAWPAQDLRLRSAAVDVSGGPAAYEVSGRAAGPGGERGRLRARIARRGDAWSADVSGSARRILGRDWSVEASDVELSPDGAVRVGSATVRTGESRAHVRGVYRPSGGSDLRATVEKVDVGAAARMLGLEGIGGELDGRVAFRGSPDRPELDARLSYSGTLHGVAVGDAALVASLSSREGTASADLSVDLSGRGGIEANATGTFALGRGTDLSDALGDATWDVRARSRDLRLELVRALVPDAPDLRGRVDGEIEASGRLDQPAASVSFRASELGVGAPSDLAADLSGSYADRQAHVQLVARDGRGRIGDVELSADVDAPGLVREPPSDPVQLGRATKWKLSLRTNARRLDELPALLKVDLPVRAVATVHVDNEPGTPPVVDVDLGATWLGPQRACAPFRTPRARARARLYQGETRVEMVGRLGTEQVIGGVLTAHTPVDAWLAQGLPSRLPETSLHAQIDRLDLSEVPYACEVASGTLQGTIDAQRLLTDDPSVTVTLAGDGLRHGDMPPTRLSLNADADAHGAHARVELSSPDGSGLRGEARMPLAWGDGVPSLGASSTVDASVRMSRFHIAPLAMLGAFSFAEGTLDGRVDVHGPVSAPAIGGRITLGDVGFGLVSPAQRFHDGTGTIVFHPGWIELDRVELHDLDGTLRTSGSIGLDGLRPDAVRLAVFANDLPIRQEGTSVGNLDLNASVRAELRPEKIEVWVETRDLSMQVAQSLRTNLQSLAPHPDVTVVGREAPAAQHEQQSEVASRDVVIHVDATRPFWVRREDFALQLATSLDVQLVGSQVKVGGWVRFRRGFVELLGKRFDLEQGRIAFMGGTEINPQIDLRVSHEVADSPGDKVFVHITGNLRQPELAFSSTVPGVTTAGDALALIAGGRGGGTGTAETASAQAASMLAGVTAGLLTLTARRELGDLVPDISIESTPGGARLRAGFDAERLVPGFLKGIVRGAYVEGFVSASQNGQNGSSGQASGGSTASGSTAGILLELTFPYDLVFTGQIQPPSAAAADVTWEP